MSSFDKDSTDFFTFLQTVYETKQRISVLLSDTILIHFKKYVKAYAKLPSQHRDAVTQFYSVYNQKLLTGFDFFDKEPVHLQFVQGVKGAEKLKIHLSSFYRMTRDIADHFQKSGDVLPNLLGREETKYPAMFQIKFLTMIRHVIITEREKLQIQAKIDELQGRQSGPNDSPFGAMIAMMSNMFTQLGQNMPQQQSAGSSSSSALPPNPLASMLGNINQGEILNTVKSVVESAETKSLVEEIGSDLSGAENFGTALSKVMTKVQDPNFMGRVMGSFNGIMSQLQHVLPPQPVKVEKIELIDDGRSATVEGPKGEVETPAPHGENGGKEPSGDVFF